MKTPYRNRLFIRSDEEQVGSMAAGPSCDMFAFFAGPGLIPAQRLSFTAGRGRQTAADVGSRKRSRFAFLKV
jgi:hypothetical protein